MIKAIMIFVGSGIITLWGISHIFPTKAVVKGFGDISFDNKRIITMEWIAEGLALCFIGLLVFAVTILGGLQNQVSVLVVRLSSLMLIVMAALTLFTGSKTSIIPIKVCPYVKTIVALLFLAGSL